ncbi:MAG TPA: hypothetical protein DD706_16275 [Nitrospiraceae bacterium]|nr:hypothetical protein [Nitrospiraceae bacterium]
MHKGHERGFPGTKHDLLIPLSVAQLDEAHLFKNLLEDGFKFYGQRVMYDAGALKDLNGIARSRQFIVQHAMGK